MAWTGRWKQSNHDRRARWIRTLLSAMVCGSRLSKRPAAAPTIRSGYLVLSRRRARDREYPGDSNARILSISGHRRAWDVLGAGLRHDALRRLFAGGLRGDGCCERA